MRLGNYFCFTYYQKVCSPLVLSILLFSCQNDDFVDAGISIDDSPSIEIPATDVNINGIRILYNDWVFSYQSEYDIVSYDSSSNNAVKDTTLRKYNYIFEKTKLYGTLGDFFILKDNEHLFLYTPKEKTFNQYSLYPGKDNSILSDKRLSFGNRFGNTNINYSSYIPLIPRPNYLPGNKKFDIVFYNPESNDKIVYNLPIDTNFLNRIYRCNSNLLSPEIDLDIEGNGVNIVFMLSCQIFNVKFDGTVSKHIVKDPSCICEINDQNFVKATAYDFFPKALPLYGNVIPDNYRGIYYQFYQSPVRIESGTRELFLRVIGNSYNHIAKILLDPDIFNPQILILDDGAYIQKGDNPDENFLHFHKIDLKLN